MKINRCWGKPLGKDYELLGQLIVANVDNKERCFLFLEYEDESIEFIEVEKDSLRQETPFSDSEGKKLFIGDIVKAYDKTFTVIEWKDGYSIENDVRRFNLQEVCKDCEFFD